MSNQQIDVQQLDVRSPRFGAAITTIVLAVAFLTAGTAIATGLLVVQTIAFAIGSLVGPHAQPYGLLFKKFVKPRLAPATKFEDPQPPRFAQTVGLGFAIVALIGLAIGSATVTAIAVGFALAAAFLNSAFGFCLGCEMYLLIKRFA
ncbi:MAG: hypothetical protein RLZZ330_129 [Actinomycetota bacterium]|jgi:hypothetical protein